VPRLALRDRDDEFPVAVAARAPLAHLYRAAGVIFDLDERRPIAARRTVEHQAQLVVFGLFAHRGQSARSINRSQ
jgi:hypothetical protein